MLVSSSVSIVELIDRHPLGRMQITIIVLYGLVALLDGFDLLAIGVAAPAMAELRWPMRTFKVEGSGNLSDRC